MTDRPVRIQRRRTKGWVMPPGTIYVGRGTMWGNPFRIGGDASVFAAVAIGGRGDVPRDRAHGAVAIYAHWIAGKPMGCRLAAMMAVKEYEAAGKPKPPTATEIATELRGKTLACWCAVGSPCHADVLLDIANADQPPAPPAERVGAEEDV